MVATLSDIPHHKRMVVTSFAVKFEVEKVDGRITFDLRKFKLKMFDTIKKPEDAFTKNNHISKRGITYSPKTLRH